MEDQSDDDNDGYDEDVRSVLPRRPRGSDNIINIAEKNPNIDKHQICYLFIETAQRTDQCNDFNISQVVKYKIYLIFVLGISGNFNFTLKYFSG